MKSSVIALLCSVWCVVVAIVGSNKLVRDARSLLSSLDSHSTLRSPTQFQHIESVPKLLLDHYVVKRRASRDVVHEGIFMIKQRNLDILEQTLNEVSDPSSAKYGQYWTKGQIDELTIDPASMRHLKLYLDLHGFKVITKKTKENEGGGAFVHASAPVHLWERVLNTKLFEFSPKDNQSVDLDDIRLLIRCHEYSLPSELIEHVSYVLNMVSLPIPDHSQRSMVPKRRTAAGSRHVDSQTQIPVGYVTPQLLNSYYDIRSNTGSSATSQAVYETIGQTFSPTDLTVFQRFFGLPVQSVAHVIGGHSSNTACRANHGNDCIEANLDVQYLMAMGQSVPTTYYYWSGQDFMLEWITAVAAMSSPPHVISISYGADEDYITSSYANSFNTMAMRLGVMGVTVVASSGDDGALSQSARSNPLGCKYAASFPASSPFVTAVGGTMGPEHNQPEVACQSDLGGIITTGGGFSSLYPTPAWQGAMINGYLASVQGTSQQPVNGYARSGRGYPDISLLANNYVIAVDNNFTAVSGTSASSPVFAGMVSLVNARRMAVNQPRVGWLNPALYLTSSLFARDITSGHNRCGAGNLVCCSQGFHAAVGWDAVTGLGSLNFTAFSQAMIDLVTLPQPSPPPLSPPVHPITNRPSRRPTAAPTQQDGFLRVMQYDQESCLGPVTSISAVNTGTCFVEYDKDGVTPVASTRYTCSAGQGEVVAELFSDTACVASNKVAEQVYAFGCVYHVATSYESAASGEDGYSIAIDCSSSSSIDSLLIGVDGSFAVGTSYDSTTGCEAGTESSVTAMLQDHCFDITSQFSYSYKITFPHANFYTGLGCRGRVEQTQDLDTTCAAVGSGSESGYYGSSYGSYSYSYFGSTSSTSSSSRRRLQYSYYDDIPQGSIDLHEIWTEATGSGAVTTVTTTPTRYPTLASTSEPTSVDSNPSSHPSPRPSSDAQVNSGAPSHLPTIISTAPVIPIVRPSKVPSRSPSLKPTRRPSFINDAPSSLPSTISHAPVSPTIDATSHPSKVPSRPPSLKPTRRPSTMSPSDVSYTSQSPAPTASVGSVTMAVTFYQELTGVSLNAWKSCGSVCSAAFMAAVVDSVDGIVTGDVAISSVVDDSSKSQAVSILITYLITANPSSLVVTSSQEAVESVTQQLSMAIRNGNMDKAIQFHAAATQAVVLLTASTADFAMVSAVPVSDTASSGSNDESEGSSSRHGDVSAIIGVFVAIFFLLTVTAVGYYGLKHCGSRRSLSSSPSSHGSNSGRRYVEVALNGMTGESSRQRRPSFMPLKSNIDDDDDEEQQVEIELGQQWGRNVQQQDAEANTNGKSASINRRLESIQPAAMNPIYTQHRMIQNEDDDDDSKSKL